MNVMDKKQAAIDGAVSYGLGGFGMGWGSFVALSGQLTQVLGFVTALMGAIVMAIKLYYDIRRIQKGRRK